MSKRAVTVAADETFPAETTTEVVYITQPAARRSGDGYALLGLLAGAVCGAVAGLLLAPRSGDQLRKQLRGATGAGAGPNVPAAAQDAVAQIRQYTAPPADDSVRPGSTAATATTAPAQIE
jgi:hypothetical protein